MTKARDEFITKAWYEGALWLYLLWPLSVLYRIITFLRRLAFQNGILKTHQVNVPVLVVGNITVGGTGKSPLVTYLVETLRQRGFNPGIVSRGYGAKLGKNQVREVFKHSLPQEVGDEPLMLKAKLDCPVFVSPSRVLAAKSLHDAGCDIIISDDGMQHYALHRDLEICVFDAERKWGNGHLLPMGPLREPLNRLSTIPFVVINGTDNVLSFPRNLAQPKAFSMNLVPQNLVNLHTGEKRDLAEFKARKVHAVAAIGNPQRFFQALSTAGLLLETHSFGDHHAYQADDFNFKEELTIVMTEKDAVKCDGFELKDAWYLPVRAELSGDLVGQVLEYLGKGVPFVP